MTGEEFAHEGFLVSADPQEHVARIKELMAIDDAVSVICLQGIGGPDPIGAIRRYGEEVLPALARETAASGA